MTTVLNRDSIQVKRDLQRRIEDYVIKYCEALEENFKQYSINSYKRNIESPTSATVGHTSYYEEQMQELLLHRGVADAIEKNARQIFEDLCQ